MIAAAPHPAYRRDIDGLRAIAVLSVLAFHAFPASAGGGFIGVDVFFVISGFLISTILFGNLAQGRLGIVDFYVRRIRRIFPALLVVLLATFVVGWLSLLADEFEQVGKHLAASAAFVANFFYWRESGYFAGAADTKPLLHLWSLGVEEQFYIVWPLLLALLWRARVDLLVATGVLALASFGINLWLVQVDPVADFYLPWSRFWELAAGAMLASRRWRQPSSAEETRPWLRNAQAVVGAACLLGGLIFIRGTHAFPGGWALLPTLGAVLLIAAGSAAWINRVVLSHRVLVWFGLVSFPLYLWHWPILSFIHILAAERPTRLARFAALGASVVLAWLTYRFIEQPVRRAPRDARLPLALACAMLALGVAGYLSFATGGAPVRPAARLAVVTAGDLGQDAFFDYLERHFVPCADERIRQQSETWKDAARCRQSRAGPVDVAIVGDSHAEHLFIGLAEALPAKNIAYYLQSSLPVTRNARFDAIFQRVIDDPAIHDVVLAAWWGLRLTEAGYGNDAVAELRDTVGAMTKAGKTVYLVDDVPNFSFSARLCKYDSSFFRSHRCAEGAAFFGKELARYSAAFEGIAAADSRVRMLHASTLFCDTVQCSMARDGKLMYRDSDHLSVEGSQLIGSAFKAQQPMLGVRGR